MREQRQIPHPLRGRKNGANARYAHEPRKYHDQDFGTIQDSVSNESITPLSHLRKPLRGRKIAADAHFAHEPLRNSWLNENY